MRKIICLIFGIIPIIIASQPIASPIRVLAIPKSDYCVSSQKVKDVWPSSCQLEPSCNYLYPVLIEEFDYNLDLPNKWDFKSHGLEDDDVGSTGSFCQWYGDAYWDNTVWPPVITNHNAQVSGGVLTLKTIPESITRKGRNYVATTGAITSFSNFRTGIFEARIKAPTGNKMWPAFWLLQNQGTYDEIDIFEFYDNSLKPSSVCDQYNLHKMTLHHGSLSSPSGNSCSRGDKYPLNIDEWHIYKLVWDDYKIMIYVDGLLKGYATKYFKLRALQIGNCLFGEVGNHWDPLININCEELSLLPDNLFPPVPYVDYGSRPWWWPSILSWPPPQPPQPYLANTVDESVYFPNKNSAMSIILNNGINYKYRTDDFSGYSSEQLDMKIDWVKVYQPFCCGVDKTACSLLDLDNQTYNTDIYTGRILNIGLASNSCTFKQAAPSAPVYRDIPVILLATEEIAIFGEAIFEGNTYAEMRITDCGSALRINAQEDEQLTDLINSNKTILDSLNQLQNNILDSITNSNAKNYIDSLRNKYSVVENEDFTISPIPATTFIEIFSSEWRFELIKNLYLVSMDGQELKLKKERKIDIEKVAKGSYFLKIEMEDSNVFIKKIIKI